MNVKLQEGRPRKRDKWQQRKEREKIHCLPHFCQLSGSTHIPLWSVHPPFHLSVHSFCPIALASTWFLFIRFIPSSHLVHPPVLSICPSLLFICSSFPSSFLNLPVSPLFLSKKTFWFSMFPNGPPGQPRPSSPKKNFWWR